MRHHFCLFFEVPGHVLEPTVSLSFGFRTGFHFGSTHVNKTVGERHADTVPVLEPSVMIVFASVCCACAFAIPEKDPEGWSTMCLFASGEAFKLEMCFLSLA